MPKHLPVPTQRRRHALTFAALLGSLAVSGHLAPGSVRAQGDQSASGPLAAPEDGVSPSASPDAVPLAASSSGGPAEPRAFDIGAILAPLMSSPDHRRLAAKVDALIRRNKADEARQVLSEAIQGGTFAALMIDQLGSADLLAFLDSVEEPQIVRPEPDNANARIQELAAALRDAKVQADAAQDELAGRDADLVSLEARLDSKTAALRDAESRLQEQAAAAARDRDGLQAAVERVRGEQARRLSEESARADAALKERDELRAQLVAGQEEDARTEAVLKERDELRAQLVAQQAADARMADLTNALSAEQAHAEASNKTLIEQRAVLDSMKSRLTAALANLDDEKARAAAVAGEMDHLRKKLASIEPAAKRSEQADAALRAEAERADALAGDVETLRNALSGAQREAASLAEARDALTREQQRSDALSQELADLERDNAALTGKVARLAELTDELSEERQRVQDLSGELSGLRAVAAREELPDHHADVTGTLPEALTIGLLSADRTASPPFSITIGSIHGAAPASAGDGNPATEGPLPPAVLRAAALPATESEGVRKLVERAESLLRTRDIASARLLLERAAASGDGRANYLLAQSYDPAVLAQWQVVGGVSGDEVKAKAHYAAAEASGYR